MNVFLSSSVTSYHPRGIIVLLVSGAWSRSGYNKDIMSDTSLETTTKKNPKNYEEYKAMLARGEIEPPLPRHPLDRTWDTSGRPPKYETAQELQRSIEAYFKEGAMKRDVVVGQGATKKVHQIPIYTISGLVLFLGFCDRASFYELENDERFADTIKKARTFIEQVYEGLLHSSNPTGAIFALKNFGWSDKSEIEVTQRTTIDSVVNAIEGEIVKTVKPDELVASDTLDFPFTEPKQIEEPKV